MAREGLIGLRFYIGSVGSGTDVVVVVERRATQRSSKG